MSNAVTQLTKRLFTSVELKIRSVMRASATRRLRRLYGNLSAKPQPLRKDAAGQTAALAGIVSSHCAASTATIETHHTAEMHLDAAEYAFSMMIAELRDVMATPAITWQPVRRPATPRFIRVAEATAQAA